MNVLANVPVLLGEAGVREVWLNVRLTVVVGANPVPVISTDVPFGPEFGLRMILGFTVNAFEAELVP